MEELKIKQEQLPVIKINYEEVKASLSETLEKYKNVVVTDEGLQDCKATQNRLAGLRLKIDGYRKDKKKIMEAPIKEFENQCKELIKLIENVESPIKTGIAVYDQKRKDEKKEIALNIIDEAIKAHNLNQKYASLLTLQGKYLNLSCSKKSVEDDVDARAFILENQQCQEEKALKDKEDAVKIAIENANKKINAKLKFEDFQYMMAEGSLSYILNEVNYRADMVYKAEHPQPVESNKEQPQVIETPKEESKQVEQEKQMYCVVMKATGSKEEITALSIFLKSNGYEYEAIEGPYKVE